jgi:hypothetical protein
MSRGALTLLLLPAFLRPSLRPSMDALFFSRAARTHLLFALSEFVATTLFLLFGLLGTNIANTFTHVSETVNYSASSPASVIFGAVTWGLSSAICMYEHPPFQRAYSLLIILLAVASSSRSRQPTSTRPPLSRSQSILISRRLVE